MNLSEARDQLWRLVRKAEEGERVILCRAGEPIAELIPYRAGKGPRRPGSAQGQFVVPDDFDEPLPLG